METPHGFGLNFMALCKKVPDKFAVGLRSSCCLFNDAVSNWGCVAYSPDILFGGTEESHETAVGVEI
jgi:hypothetical protein